MFYLKDLHSQTREVTFSRETSACNIQKIVKIVPNEMTSCVVSNCVYCSYLYVRKM